MSVHISPALRMTNTHTRTVWRMHARTNDSRNAKEITNAKGCQMQMRVIVLVPFHWPWGRLLQTSHNPHTHKRYHWLSWTISDAAINERAGIQERQNTLYAPTPLSNETTECEQNESDFADRRTRGWLVKTYGYTSWRPYRRLPTRRGW